MRINEGNPSFTNPLIDSLSPYLRQHAHNPVYWYPWGEEALKRAKEEDKPILLSIGYSTCYWCHVMEREVFENLSIASLMNKHFINIKIDREEHPHLDEIYMVARQLVTQEGGWPNNVFLTPDLKPFYAGGTYGAKESHGKPGFPRLLEWLHAAWVEDREKLTQVANDTARLMENFLVAKKGEALSDFSPMIADARAALERNYDAQSGGFFKQPKFPHENYLQFLLTHYQVTNDEQSLEMATQSLAKMASGGIYDQVGCGFHRYAVDKDWFVPHFEKMLYNQGLLARTYAKAAKLTGNPFFTDIARGICEFVIGAMTQMRGGFYAAIDAETDEVEGAYYAWNSSELEKILSDEEASFFIHHYGLADIPHFPGHKHPQGEAIVLRKSLDAAAQEQKIPYVQLAAHAGAVMNKLLKVRNERKAPNLDTKIIVGWNGLMIDGLAYAGMVLKQPLYVQQAAKSAQYILKNAFYGDGTLGRCITEGRLEHAATLEDYAYLMKGLLTLYRAGGDKEMLEAAKYLGTTAHKLFGDKAGGFFTSLASDDVIIRAKNGDDSALPNANAVMAENFLALHSIEPEAGYGAEALRIVRAFIGDEKKIWLEYTSMLSVAMRMQKEIDVNAAPAQPIVSEKAVEMSLQLLPKDAGPGDAAELAITLVIKNGYYIQPGEEFQKDGTATRLAIRGKGVEVLGATFPEPVEENGMKIYEGTIVIRAQIGFDGALDARKAVDVMVHYHPCREGVCFAAAKEVASI